MSASPEVTRLRAIADWEMAIVALRNGDGAAARARIARARLTLAVAGAGAGDLDRLGVLEQMSYHTEGNPAAARLGAGTGDAASADLSLARAWSDPDPADRLARLNALWSAAGLTGATLEPGPAAPLDRLAATTPAPVRKGPRVSVLVAAHRAAETLPTALRSLLAQSWTNLEIIVIDDASDDGGATVAVAKAFARADRRVRLLTMAVNGGAYVARNRGLAKAWGRYVTLMDADDWAHPERIATQVRHLEAHPDAVACLTPQARAREDLAFLRWTGRGDIVTPCTASLTMRRKPVIRQLGAWDTVRVSADRELIRRLRRVFGPDAVTSLGGPPLTLQRDHADSAVRDPVLGIVGEVSGARRVYLGAQEFHHAQAGACGLRYRPDGPRPFPAPAPMRSRREERLAFEVVVAGELRRPGPARDAARDTSAAGTGPVGLLLLRDFAPDLDDRLDPELQALVHAGRAHLLSRGETATCDRLLVPEPVSLDLRRRHLPRVLTDRMLGPDGPLALDDAPPWVGPIAPPPDGC